MLLVVLASLPLSDSLLIKNGSETAVSLTESSSKEDDVVGSTMFALSSSKSASELREDF